MQAARQETVPSGIQARHKLILIHLYPYRQPSSSCTALNVDADAGKPMQVKLQLSTCLLQADTGVQTL